LTIKPCFKVRSDWLAKVAGAAKWAHAHRDTEHAPYVPLTWLALDDSITPEKIHSVYQDGNVDIVFRLIEQLLDQIGLDEIWKFMSESLLPKDKLPAAIPAEIDLMHGLWEDLNIHGDGEDLNDYKIYAKRVRDDG